MADALDTVLEKVSKLPYPMIATSSDEHDQVYRAKLRRSYQVSG
jgi:hypothetical protein